MRAHCLSGGLNPRGLLAFTKKSSFQGCFGDARSGKIHLTPTCMGWSIQLRRRATLWRPQARCTLRRKPHRFLGVQTRGGNMYIYIYICICIYAGQTHQTSPLILYTYTQIYSSSVPNMLGYSLPTYIWEPPRLAFDFGAIHGWTVQAIVCTCPPKSFKTPKTQRNKCLGDRMLTQSQSRPYSPNYSRGNFPLLSRNPSF